MTTAPCSGDLRHRVTIQAEARTPDEGGGAALSWDDLASVWAGIRPASGSERWQAGQLQAVVSHAITMRYRRDVRAKHRIRFVDDGRERLFNVRVVMNVDERGEWLKVLAEEGVAV